jgi:hypothetical protein
MAHIHTNTTYPNKIGASQKHLPLLYMNPSDIFFHIPVSFKNTIDPIKQFYDSQFEICYVGLKNRALKQDRTGSSQAISTLTCDLRHGL